jgi:TatD DNase family protein
MYIDTHSHIYLNEFAEDLPAVLDRAWQQRLDTILMPAIDSATHGDMIDVETKYPDRALSMMGLHPTSVKAGFREELAVLDRYFAERKFVAVGETGLDYYWDLSFREEQIEAFEYQMELAIRYAIPVVIHSRESTDDCIVMVKRKVQRGLTGVFHCFGGSREQALKILDMGFYLGIGGVLTFRKSGLDDVMRGLPLDQVVLETDAPYLAPTPYRGKRNEPSYLPKVAEKLAEIKQLTEAEIAEITSRNAKKLFGL